LSLRVEIVAVPVTVSTLGNIHLCLQIYLMSVSKHLLKEHTGVSIHCRPEAAIFREFWAFRTCIQIDKTVDVSDSSTNQSHIQQSIT